VIRQLVQPFDVKTIGIGATPLPIKQDRRDASVSCADYVGMVRIPDVAGIRFFNIQLLNGNLENPPVWFGKTDNLGRYNHIEIARQAKFCTD
jgi:hypothetical protein